LAASYSDCVLIAGVVCGAAAIVCAVFGVWSLRRPGAEVAELPARLVAPAQLAAAVMLAAGAAVALAAPQPLALALVSMCLVGAVGTMAAGFWQTARYALRREAPICGGDCAACPLSCR
jgi:hypothetical protein